MKKILAEIKELESKLASGGGNEPLHCDGKKDCENPVAYIDEKGWVYCEKHGLQVKQSRRCRKLTPKELKNLQSSGSTGGKY